VEWEKLPRASILVGHPWTLCTIRTFADYKRKTGISPLLANKDKGLYSTVSSKKEKSFRENFEFFAEKICFAKIFAIFSISFAREKYENSRQFRKIMGIYREKIKQK
jgi:hypothetical protein